MCKYGTFNKQNLPELRNPLKLEKTNACNSFRHTYIIKRGVVVISGMSRTILVCINTENFNTLLCID